MRILDAAPPTVTSGDRPGPEVPMGQWAAQLYVAIEGVEYTAAVWDDSPAHSWDDPGGDPTWDELGGEVVEYVDAICWLQGLTIDTGEPDASTRYTSARLTLTLDNRDGTWSRYGPTGSLSFFPPGRQVLVWAVLDEEPFWLFAGRIATWQESADRRVELTAFDAFSELNVRIGEWTAGAAGDTPRERLLAILALIGWTGLVKGDVGDITCLARTTDASPLEEMQAVAESDAGVLVVDPDGRLAFGDRRWIRGRDDQPRPPIVVSGNLCDVDAVLWELELRSDDEHLVNVVTLTNDAVSPITVTSRDLVSEGRYGSYTFPENRPDDLWETVEQGQAVADYLVDLRGDPMVRIGRATLYLHDPRFDLWELALNLRRGDLVRFVQDTVTQGGGTQRLDLDLVIAALRHEVTPDGWVVTLGTTPTVGSRYVPTWDETTFTWDLDDDLNVWSH